MSSEKATPPISAEQIEKERAKFRNYGHLAGVAKGYEILKDYDDKTGLLKSTKFREEVEAIRSSKKSRGKGALLIADIDDFKSLNEAFGHGVVDENYLIPVARKVDDVARRETDTKTCRFGGEEFLVYLDGTNLEDAIKIAEELQQDVNQLRIGISVGVATFLNDGTYEEVFNNANKALLAAKATPTKNEVVAWVNGSAQVPA